MVVRLLALFENNRDGNERIACCDKEPACKLIKIK